MMDLSVDEQAELQGLKDDLKGILQEVKERMGVGFSTKCPQWMASIEMALDHDHNWVGGSYDRTFQDEIDMAVMGQVEYDRTKGSPEWRAEMEDREFHALGHGLSS